MALLWYLKPIDGLPHPKCSLSSTIQTQVIAQANEEVRKAMKSINKFLYTPLVYEIFQHINFLHETFITQKFPNPQ